MAKITQITRQVGVERTNTPSPQLSGAMNDALVDFGGAVSSVGSMLQQRQEQRENFTAENEYRRFNLALEDEINQAAANIEPGGANFHDDFVTKVFKPKRDEFLAKVPERLKSKFSTMLDDSEGADALNWSITAAKVERDESYRWYGEQIGEATNELAAGIELNPEAYSEYHARGVELIQTSGLPTADKAKLEYEWDQLAMTANLNQMLANDPQGVIRDLGGDTRNLSPTTQFAMLSRAVQWQESRDNPNAVSEAGAIGLMQVMPKTAEEIAGKLGDAKFPKGAPEAAIKAYLSNPVVNQQYGEFYLREQLQRFANTRNPVETALVAYNAGPSVAEKWVESGYNDKVLPAETRKYKREIMGTLTAPGMKGDPAQVQFVMTNDKALGAVNPDLKGRVADAFATLGLGKVRVNSGHRTHAENEAVGGADGSQHLEGNAIDIDVSGMKIEQRIELIKSLSAAGVTGLGIGANSIHADVGGRRAWGYKTSAGGGEVPKWATAVIAEHLKGTTPPPRAVGSRYAGLDYGKRQQFLSSADQAVTAQQTAAAKVSAVEKVQVQQSRDNNLALLRKTGQGDPAFSETDIATVLGEDDYLTYARDRDVALRSFTATESINTMTDAQMEQRYNDYTPRVGADFEADQRVQTAVRAEINRVTQLRARSPDRAALEVPELKQEADALAAMMDEGQVDSPSMQRFIARMLGTQGDLGISPKARAPVPREWAMQIGRQLTDLPRPTQLTGQERVKMSPEQLAEYRAADRAKVEGAVFTLYTALNTTFGEYTDEVVTYALAEYQGTDKERAEALNGYAKAVQAGSGRIFGATVDQATDVSQSDQAFNLLNPATWFQPPAEGDYDPEAALRRQEAEESATSAVEE